VEPYFSRNHGKMALKAYVSKIDDLEMLSSNKSIFMEISVKGRKLSSCQSQDLIGPSLIFYAVEDRMPRVYPWINELSQPFTRMVSR